MRVNRLFRQFKGATIDPDALIYRDAVNTAGGTLTSSELFIVSNLIKSLKVKGLWVKCIAIYPFAGSTGDIKATHSVNLKTPGTHDLIFNNTIAGDHTSGGWTGNGSTSYAQTGIIPSTHLTLNDVHLSYDSSSGPSSDNREWGAFVSGSQRLDLFVHRVTSQMQFDCYDNANGQVVGSNTNGNAIFLASRRSASDAEIYKDGVSLASTTTTGGTQPNIELYLNANNNNGSPANSNSRTCRFASAGSGMSDADATNLKDILVSFQTDLGR